MAAGLATAAVAALAAAVKVEVAAAVEAAVEAAVAAAGLWGESPRRALGSRSTAQSEPAARRGAMEIGTEISRKIRVRREGPGVTGAGATGAGATGRLGDGSRG